MKLIIRLQST